VSGKEKERERDRQDRLVGRSLEKHRYSEYGYRRDNKTERRGERTREG
jgi:hypothetical protein